MSAPSTTAVPPADTRRIKRSRLLKACVLATGFSGIVAEYVMATIASYLLGAAVIQYVLVITLMLFCMSLGARWSKHVEGRLLEAFVAAELALSLLCGLSAIGTYAASFVTEQLGPVIYGMAALIGILVGLELPLVARLNAEYEPIRINLSAVMEFDYVGALLGGLFFAFVGLPHLGLTYTPALLGTVNLGVAAVLAWTYRDGLRRPWVWGAGFAFVTLALIFSAAFTRPVVLYGEQKGYQDTIVYEEQSRYQRIVMTEWRGHHWLYLDRNIQFSSYDEERYHESLVHPALSLAPSRRNVLILGGGDGLAAREVLKYDDVERVTLVDLDPAVTQLGQTHPVLLALNEGSLLDERVEVHNEDAAAFLRRSDHLYDAIIVDLPDPKTVDLARLYSRSFYRLAARHLAQGGTLVTQATSPYFSSEAFFCILKTMREAGLSAVGYHAHVPTMGEWGWVLGQKTMGPEEGEAVPDHDALRSRLEALPLEGVPLRYLTPEVLRAQLTWSPADLQTLGTVRPNTTLDLALYHYYHDGRWDLY